jgi:hypothetical protein
MLAILVLSKFLKSCLVAGENLFQNIDVPLQSTRALLVDFHHGGTAP